MRLGLVVNPIAGMGGRVGLKGTDGQEILEKARKLGAKEEAPLKARRALEPLLEIKDQLTIVAAAGDMGEKEAADLGFKLEVVGDPKDRTTMEDTIAIAKDIASRDIDLLMFAGGDGTARNIYTAVGESIAVIGIPAGVKIHSGVFANHPKAAGEVALQFLRGDAIDLKSKEVMDIDEEKFRDGQVMARLFGYMNTPFIPQLVQTQKAGSIEGEEASIEGISYRIVDDMKEDTYYIVGSGTTTRPIMEKLGLDNTLLGVDIVKNKQLVKKDCNEEDILSIIGDNKAKIIVTVIGGQGYLFGRGNQQLSKRVVEKVGKENIIIVASKRKLLELAKKPLLVDFGDPDFNENFSGFMMVRTSYTDEAVYKVKGV